MTRHFGAARNSNNTQTNPTDVAPTGQGAATPKHESAGHDGSVADVGAGTSALVDRLLQAGVTDVTVVDVVSRALQISRDQLAPAGAGAADTDVAAGALSGPAPLARHVPDPGDAASGTS